MVSEAIKFVNFIQRKPSKTYIILCANGHPVTAPFSHLSAASQKANLENTFNSWICKKAFIWDAWFAVIEPLTVINTF